MATASRSAARLIVPHVPTADLDAALRGVVEPGDELHQGGLGRAGAAQDADRLARADVQLDAGERVLRRLGAVLEGHALKVHAAVRDTSVTASGGEERAAVLVQHLA